MIAPGWWPIIDDRNRPLKHIQRAQIILFSADRLPVLQVAQPPASAARPCGGGKSATLRPGWTGLLRDRTRPPGRKPVPPATVAQVVAMTCSEPPGEAAHWTGRAMAKAVGLSLRGLSAQGSATPAPHCRSCHEAAADRS
jgi:hypothetical protein